MKRADFIEFYCARRKCSESSAVTNWYNMRRIRKLMKLDPNIVPKSNKWVKPSAVSVISKLSNVPRKNLMGSLVGYLRATRMSEKNIEKYTEAMSQAISDVKAQYDKQELSTTQKKNFLPMSKVRKLFRELKQQANDNELWSKKEWSPSQRQLAQKIMMLAFHGGSEPPPRLEFANLVYTKDPSDDKENNVLFYSKRSWRAIVRRGKTASSDNPFHLKFSRATARLLNKYTKMIDAGDYVFTSKSGQKLTANAYGKKLRSLFRQRYGRDIGASLLRVMYLTEKHKDIPRLAELRKTANSLMHSVPTSLGIYSKKS